MLCCHICCRSLTPGTTYTIASRTCCVRSLSGCYAFIYISNIDRDGDGRAVITRCTTIISGRDNHRIGCFCFIIQRCTCLQLPRSGHNTKGIHICATKRIGECVTYIRIRCTHGNADVGTCETVFSATERVVLLPSVNTGLLLLTCVEMRFKSIDRP